MHRAIRTFAPMDKEDTLGSEYVLPRQNRQLHVLWAFWALVCLCTLMCLAPPIIRASLYVPHLHLHIDPHQTDTWVAYVDEMLQVVSYFVADLRPNLWLGPSIEQVSNSAFSFDYTSWCRDMPSAGSTLCYKGHGLDVVTGLVTDFGVQLGVAGKMDNPVAFGRSLASTFRKTVADLDRTYLDLKRRVLAPDEQPSVATLKLESVHRLKQSMDLAVAMHTLEYVRFGLFVVACCFHLLALFAPLRKPWCALAVALVIACELCTMANYGLETFYLGKLNQSFRTHALIFTAGLGATLLVVETILGVLIVIFHFSQ